MKNRDSIVEISFRCQCSRELTGFFFEGGEELDDEYYTNDIVHCIECGKVWCVPRPLIPFIIEDEEIE